MKIKICGITNQDDAMLCRDQGADMIGFILYNKSKRYIPIKKAERISNLLADSVQKVGVFVNQSPEIINKLVKLLKLDMVQLHGEEKPEMAEQIKAPVIKAFRIDESFDFNLIMKYRNITPLLDTYAADIYGGTGKTFDWNKIPLEIRKICILAGGVSETNIEKINREIKPYAVDVSSSLEKFRGKKDEEKVNIFFSKIKQLRSK